MSFDQDDFEADLLNDLKTMTHSVYKLRRIYQIQYRPRIYARYRGSSEQNFRTSLILEGSKTKSSLSAHDQVLEKMHTKAIHDAADRIIDRIAQEAPILADPCLNLDISIASSTRQGERALFSIGGRTLGDPYIPTYITEIAQRTSLAISRLQGIPTGPRTFSFPWGVNICAQTPQDALRAHVALVQPSLFNHEARAHRRLPVIHELLDSSQMLSALND